MQSVFSTLLLLANQLVSNKLRRRRDHRVLDILQYIETRSHEYIIAFFVKPSINSLSDLACTHRASPLGGMRVVGRVQRVCSEEEMHLGERRLALLPLVV